MKFNEKGLIPMIIQDAQTEEILSLVYGNEESISKMKETGYVWRYSRTQKRMMQKGESSGHMQRVVEIVPDCDSDALLVRVEANGPACHLGTASCFVGTKEVSVFKKLEATIEDRIRNPILGSYTSKLIKEDMFLKGKLREELEEFIEFKDKKNLVWEAADLFYFMLVYLKKNGGSLKEVEEELSGRMKK